MRSSLSVLVGTVGLVLPAVAFSQGVVTGTVRTPSLVPVSGATVVLSGTSVITNELGVYRLVVPSDRASGSDTIRVSKLGYRPAAVPVTFARGEIRRDVQLVALAVPLSAIVVTGTTVGSQTLKAQAATISSVDAADLRRTAPVTSVTDMVTARVPSVSVLQSTGTSGTSQAIRVRGTVSVSLSTEPLVFIDGVLADSKNTTANIFVGGQTSNRLSDINPDDIERIEIVKGPAAATLFGADASAGVIQIITKRGRVGANQGFNQTISTEYNSITMPWTPSDNYGSCTAPLVAATSLNPLCRGQTVGAIVRDNPILRDHVFRDGQLTGIDWSGRGGGANYGYFLSLTDTREDGVLRNNFFRRRGGRVSFNWIPSARWAVDASSGVVTTETRLPNNDNGLGFMNLTRLGSPLTRVDDSVATRLGQRNGWLQPDRRRPALENIDNHFDVARLTPTLTLKYAPAQWLTNRLTLGIDASNAESNQLYPKNVFQWYPGVLNDGQVTTDRLFSTLYTIDYQGNARRAFAKGAWVTDLSFGAQLISNRASDLAASGTGLVTNANDVVPATPSTSRALGQFTNETRAVGLLAQLQIANRDRLFLQLGLRRDENSAFGSRVTPFYLPKVGLSYVPSEEKFWASAVPWVSTLKLRAAWGMSGRAPGPTASLQTYIPAPYVVSSTTTAAGVAPGSPGNQDLEPERGVELEGGFDASLFHDRIGLEATYFDKRSRDLLIARPLAPSLGFSGSPFVNIGEAANQGLELSIHASPITTRRVSWDITGSFSTLHNELTDLGDVAAFGGFTRINVDRPLWYWNSLKIRNVDVANNRVIVSDTAEYLGNQWPTKLGNIGTTLTLFRSIRIGGQIDWKSGYSIYNLGDDIRDRTSANTPSRRSILRDSLPPAERMRFYGPFFTEGKTSASRPVVASDVVEAYIQDASFFRLREVSVVWTIPARATRLLRVSGAQLLVAGRNLALWSDYEGADPEVQRNPNEQGITLDQFTVPPVRRYVARLSFQF